MKNITKSIMVAAIGSSLCAGSASAQVTAVVGGSAQSGANYVNFDSLSGGSISPYTSGALTVDFSGNAATANSSGYQGGSATPDLSGNNNLNFGSTYSGGDNTTYLFSGTTGNTPIGSLTFNFSSGENYFGLLWGSVDANNTLTFYSGANGTGSVIETLTGAEISAANTDTPQLADNGDIYDAWGTAYVNVDTSTPFESVVATSQTFTFEIDNVAYGSTVPDGGMTAGFLGGAVLALGALRRRLIRA